jgi:hypothetical protein
MSALASATVSEQDVVTPFEQNLLVGLVFVIMFGLGAGLTVKDFTRALKRPKGVAIGWFAQYGVMPLLAFTLAAVFLFQLPLEYAAPVAVGALLMGSVPGGTTSNLFTYFSKGNLALSVIMTINTTLWALVMTPLALFFFGGFLFADNPEWHVDEKPTHGRRGPGRLPRDQDQAQGPVFQASRDERERKYTATCDNHAPMQGSALHIQSRAATSGTRNRIPKDRRFHCLAS